MRFFSDLGPGMRKSSMAPAVRGAPLRAPLPLSALRPGPGPTSAFVSRDDSSPHERPQYCPHVTEEETGVKGLRRGLAAGQRPTTTEGPLLVITMLHYALIHSFIHACIPAPRTVTRHLLCGWRSDERDVVLTQRESQYRDTHKAPLGVRIAMALGPSTHEPPDGETGTPCGAFQGWVALPRTAPGTP